MAFSVGNGTRVRFLKNSWYGDDPLCVSFPSLFAIALEKEAWVEDVWNHSERGVWAPRQLNDWEVVVVEHFFQRLQGNRVCREVDDHVVWTKSKDVKFSVKSFYKALELERQGDFPTKVGFFAWEATWNKVLILD